MYRGCTGDVWDLPTYLPTYLPAYVSIAKNVITLGSCCSLGSIIENPALALEMSAIGGKNVANLAVDFVKRRGITIERESAGRKKLN